MANKQNIRHRAFVARQAQKQGMWCIYCRQKMVIRAKTHGRNPPDNMATKDHIVPKVRGGRNWMTNFLVCCQACNSERSDLPADLFALFKIWQRNGKPEL